MLRIALAVVVIAGCSHPSWSPHGGGDKGGPTPDAGVIAAAPDAAPADAPVTEADCHKLIDHVLEVITSQTFEDLPEDERAAAKQDAHDALAKDFIAGCLTLDRPGYECMLNAPDRDTFAACGE